MNQTADNLVDEETTAAYFQFELNGDLGDMPFSILTGLRYEVTDVFATSLSPSYRTIWEDNNDVAIRVDSSQESVLVS